MASLESQLATVKAQADADQLNAEHLMEQMEQRYAALAAEHTQVSGRRTRARSARVRSMRSPGTWGVRRKDARAIKIARLSPRFFFSSSEKKKNEVCRVVVVVVEDSKK